MKQGKEMKYVGDSRIPAREYRKKNIPRDYSEFPGKTEAFWPDFLLKEWLVGAVFLIGFLCLTIVNAPPLEKIADPTDTTYIPLPDWYFLFLYQLLKYSFASGPYTVIGALVIPGLAFGALLLAPFLDRSPHRRPSKRPFATGFMLLAVTAIVFLTWESVSMHDWEAAAKQGEIAEEGVIDKDSVGYAIYDAQGCSACHGGELQGVSGPELIRTGLTVEEVEGIIVNGTGDMPAGLFDGSEEELETLAQFIAELDTETTN